MLFALFIERTRVVARFKHCREDVRWCAFENPSTAAVFCCSTRIPRRACTVTNVCGRDEYHKRKRVRFSSSRGTTPFEPIIAIRYINSSVLQTIIREAYIYELPGDDTHKFETRSNNAPVLYSFDVQTFYAST